MNSFTKLLNIFTLVNILFVSICIYPVISHANNDIEVPQISLEKNNLKNNYGYDSLTDEDHILKKKDIEDTIDNIEDNDFDIIYIGSPRCPYCMNFVPKLNEVSKNLGIDKITYLDITDATYEEKVLIKDKLQLKGMPTTLLIRDGAIVDEILGDISYDNLKNIIEAFINE